MDRVLPTYPADRSASAGRQLEKLGVIVRTSTRVIDIDGRCVEVEMADRTTETVPTRTTLWAAGILASSFVDAVAARPGPPRTGAAGPWSGPT